jgi:hypothetical protein
MKTVVSGFAWSALLLVAAFLYCSWRTPSVSYRLTRAEMADIRGGQVCYVVGTAFVCPESTLKCQDQPCVYDELIEEYLCDTESERLRIRESLPRVKVEPAGLTGYTNTFNTYCRTRQYCVGGVGSCDYIPPLDTNYCRAGGPSDNDPDEYQQNVSPVSTSPSGDTCPKKG